MVASLSGSLALAAGLVVVVLPLLAAELSRPRDGLWGALLLLLGLTLITSADRLTGSPMLAVLCGGLLIGRLGLEVLQLRWRQLTPEEQQRLSSLERWQSSLQELSASVAQGSSALTSTGSSLLAALPRGGSKPRSGKRWVRASNPESSPASSPESSPEPSTVVQSFAEVEALLHAAASSEAG